MTGGNVEALAATHAERKAAADEAYRELLDAVVDEVGAGGANIRALADRAGIARATVYNELERRAKAAEHSDALEGNGHRPAPADTDVELTDDQRRALELIAAGQNPLVGADRVRRSTVEALRRRRLVREDSRDLTELGRQVAGELTTAGAAGS